MIRQSHIDHDMRTAPRRPVRFRGFVRETGATIFAVDVADLSTDGCRFRSADGFETATIVWLKIDGAGARQARIIWRDGDSYGCEFVAPIRTKSIDDISGPGQLA